MSESILDGRRQFLEALAGVSGSLLLTACLKSPESAASKEKEGMNKSDEGEEVSPAEDLMREHGILKRVLLIYREGIRRIDSKEDLSPEVLVSSANLIRRFIEDYHEK